MGIDGADVEMDERALMGKKMKVLGDIDGEITPLIAKDNENIQLELSRLRQPWKF